MSCDLASWHAAQRPTEEAALQTYLALIDEQSGTAPAVPAVAQFHQALIDAFRDLVPGLSAEESEAVPWTVQVHHSPECVIVNVSFGRINQIGDALIELAGRYGLTTFDPQDHDIISPSTGPSTRPSVSPSAGPA